METTNKKRVIMLAVLGIAIVCICIIGVFAKKAYDRHQEELRLQAVETKNSEIDAEYLIYEYVELSDIKLEALKQEVESAENYKKTENAYEECSAHYEKIIAQMKNSFVSEYDDTIKTIADKIGDDVEKADDKETLKNAASEFTTFKDTLKNDFENYNTIEQDSFDEYNSTIDEYVKKYNDRVTAIEKAEEEDRKKEEEEKKKAEEEAKKKAEEEARKKAEEEAAAKAAQEEAERKAAEEAAEQSSGSSYGGGSDYSYDDSNDYSYSSGSSGYSDSGSGSDYSGGSSSSDGSSGNGSSGDNVWHYWSEDESGNKIDGSGFYYDHDNGNVYDESGNYQGNDWDWIN